MIGLLIVTHCDLGKEFLNAAEFIVGRMEAVDVISITQAQESEEIRKLIADKISVLNRGEGVIILTDMFGGTPSNLRPIFDLPMVISIAQNRSNMGLSELAETAQEAGKMSISLAGNLLK